MNETGAVKFSCEHVATELPEFAGFAELNTCRRRLFDLGLVGVDASGVGFGNVSIRNGATDQFYITGSGTGRFSHLTPAHYAKIIAYDFEKNWLRCEGLVLASSESLTHAAVYESDPNTKAVIHCHDLKLWMALQNKIPRTPRQVEYGTPEMAYAVKRLFHTTDVTSKKIFVMAAHEAGLVTFGRDLEEAFAVLMQFRDSFTPESPAYGALRRGRC